MAAKKKAKVFPFFVLAFSCTSAPLSSKMSCPDDTFGPYETEAEALVFAKDVITDNPDWSSVVLKATQCSKTIEVTFNKV